MGGYVGWHLICVSVLPLQIYFRADKVWKSCRKLALHNLCNYAAFYEFNEKRQGLQGVSFFLVADARKFSIVFLPAFFEPGKQTVSQMCFAGLENKMYWWLTALMTFPFIELVRRSVGCQVCSSVWNRMLSEPSGGGKHHFRKHSLYTFQTHLVCIWFHQNRQVWCLVCCLEIFSVQ